MRNKKVKKGYLGLAEIRDGLESEVYSFSFRPNSHAQFILCEETGLFAVHSGWADGAYMFANLAGRLKAGLLDMKSEVILEKFAISNPETWRHDAHGLDTKEALLAHLEDNRGDLGVFERDGLVSEIGLFTDRLSGWGEDQALANFHESRLWEFTDGNLADFVCHHPNVRWLLFRDALLPWFQNWLESKEAAMVVGVDPKEVR